MIYLKERAFSEIYRERLRLAIENRKENKRVHVKGVVSSLKTFRKNNKLSNNFNLTINSVDSSSSQNDDWNNTDYLRHESIDLNSILQLIDDYKLNKYLCDKNLEDEDVKKAVDKILSKAAISCQYTEYFKVFLPIIIVAFSFIFITWIGGKLQDDSFKRIIVFEKKIARFQKAEDQAMQIGFDLRDIFYRVKWDLAIDKDSTRYKDYAREQRKQLERLGSILRSFPEETRDSLNGALLDTIKNIDMYTTGDNDNINLKYIEYLKEVISSSLIQYLDKKSR